MNKTLKNLCVVIVTNGKFLESIYTLNSVYIARTQKIYAQISCITLKRYLHQLFRFYFFITLAVFLDARKIKIKIKS